jgi:two-component system KDP operon response regulator KdpE
VTGENDPSVLVADDEQAMRRFLRASLTAHGYAVHEAATGEQALKEARVLHPDVILLDLGLPDLDGTEITRCLRAWSETPIIILSVRDQQSDKIAALDAGADDYLSKPFGLGELLARIRAALRRSAQHDGGPTLIAGDLTVDVEGREVHVGANLVQLTPTEFHLLEVLVRNAGKVLTHRQLVREVWGGTYYDDAIHLLRVNISNLRQKLEADAARPRLIVTEPGVGYRLQCGD